MMGNLLHKQVDLKHRALHPTPQLHPRPIHQIPQRGTEGKGREDLGGFGGVGELKMFVKTKENKQRLKYEYNT